MGNGAQNLLSASNEPQSQRGKLLICFCNIILIFSLVFHVIDSVMKTLVKINLIKKLQINSIILCISMISCSMQQQLIPFGYSAV